MHTNIASDQNFPNRVMALGGNSADLCFQMSLSSAWIHNASMWKKFSQVGFYASMKKIRSNWGENVNP